MIHAETNDNGLHTVQFSIGRFDYAGEFDGKELRLSTFDERVGMNIEITATQTSDTNTRYEEYFSTLARAIADQLNQNKLLN